MTTRGFEVVSKYQDQAIMVPQRSTQQAAGYDFEAAANVVLPGTRRQVSPTDRTPVLIPTGIKAYMAKGEYLQLVARSSAPIKKQIMMPNGVGVVDGDYYNNESNEGEIFFQYINFGFDDIEIKKGERIGQGIFLSYLLADDDQGQAKAQRTGGFGSTGDR